MKTTLLHLSFLEPPQLKFFDSERFASPSLPSGWPVRQCPVRCQTGVLTGAAGMQKGGDQGVGYGISTPVIHSSGLYIHITLKESPFYRPKKELGDHSGDRREEKGAEQTNCRKFPSQQSDFHWQSANGP